MNTPHPNAKIETILELDYTKQVFSITQIAISHSAVVAWASRCYSDLDIELLSDDSIFILNEMINSKEDRRYYNNRWRDFSQEELVKQFAKSIELELPIKKGAADLFLFAELTALCNPYRERLNTQELHLEEFEKQSIREKISLLESEIAFPELELNYDWINTFGTLAYYKWKELFDVQDLESDMDSEYHEAIPAQFLLAASQWLTEREINISKSDKLWKLQVLKKRL